MIHKLIYYLSYLSLPYLLYLIFVVIKKIKTKKLKNLSLDNSILFIFLIGVLVFIYSRFIEPNIICINQTEINVGFSGKLILISDTHLGVYKGKSFLERVVKKIDSIKNVDAVIIAGDITYHADDNELETLLKPLKKLKYPVFAVLGNHDYIGPNPPNLEMLKSALSKNRVNLLENSSSLLKEKNIHILGLGDRWKRNDKISKLDEFSENDNIVVIAHNPDTIMRYKNRVADLTLSGHTHGGQIRIPFIYKNMIPSNYSFDQGFYNVNNNKLFISSGVGEVGLPMRFLVPPSIDVIILK
ncbi:metallophosphoesterase [bacterium]|nr:metallophosphoesterase [bacterium]